MNTTTVHTFLDTLASAEPESWPHTLAILKKKYPDWLGSATPCQKLNELSPLILKQGDQELIHLYQRALRNHDDLSEEKAEPFTVFYKNYQPPAFLIPEIHLTLDVQSDRVLVTTHLQVVKNSDAKTLILDGRGHRVLSVTLDGALLPKERYRVTHNELILHGIESKSSDLVIESEIDPFHNNSMEGLYLSGEFLTTQCETEGARRIFYTIDRPDVLSRITTTLLADKEKYPYRLSNGNLLSETTEGGRTKIVWEDPIPKPSYLFACVLGRFGKLEDTFTTKSGRRVALEVYVEPGKEPRAAYSLTALKLAMQFDEEFFDREYDLDCMKMVAVPDFNAGAMENKGLMIFNSSTLLVDEHSGTDARFRRVATVVAHEYFHNWSGNRVTVRNWFEISLKEGFTDFRAMLFGEWLFGSAFIRPKDVQELREHQFPEETSGKGHPIMVESYVAPNSIYDATTYIKGREVFRALSIYMDMMVPGGFREAQNLYFSRYDGQAVTFRELLSAANEVLKKHTGSNLSQFERWFNQQGTPEIKAQMTYLPEKKKIQLLISQSCPHPKTGLEQQPFLIPFSFEFLRSNGTVAHAKENYVLKEKSHLFEISAEERLIPLFMHDYGAPVLLSYDYTLSDLACLMNHAKDPFIQWEAGQNYFHLAFEEFLLSNTSAGSRPDLARLLKPYADALHNPHLTPLAKAQLLQTPSLRAISQKLNDYDFAKLKKAKELFTKELAHTCSTQLEALLKQYPEPIPFEPTSEQMQIRELRNACWNLLAKNQPASVQKVFDTYRTAANFDTAFGAFKILANLDCPEKAKAAADFYEKWKEDKNVFNYWLEVQSSSSSCTVKDLKKLMETPGYDARNPNHVRAVLRVFVTNLGQYHDSKGEGYAFLVDQILEVAKTNPMLAHNYVTVPAVIDFEKLPEKQRALMVREFKRLLDPAAPPETRDLIKKLLAQ